MVKINIDKLICDALICIIFFFIDHVLSFQLTLVLQVYQQLSLGCTSTLLHMVIKPLIHLYALSVNQICMYHIPYQYKYLNIKINANSAYINTLVVIFFQSNGPVLGYFHKYTFKRMSINTENGPSKFVFIFQFTLVKSYLSMQMF